MLRPVPALATILLLGIAGDAVAQESAFRASGKGDGTGQAFRYRKSNRDGTHAGDITLFVPGPNRLESFKANGDTGATLVKAWLDPKRLTVVRFESWKLTTNTRTMQALLEAVPGTDSLVITLGKQRFASLITHWPWHSYDFDFAGLGAALPHLVAAEGKFTIGIADLGAGPNGPIMEDKGPVEVTFVRREEWNGRRTRLYTIDGPGLSNRGGKLWADVETGRVAGFEIEMPDEPGFESGKLVLTKVEKMNERGWSELQRAHLAPGN